MTPDAGRRENLRTADPATPSVRVQLFGGLNVVFGDGRPVVLASARARSLLGYLVLHHATPQDRQRLAYLLWPDSTDGQARTNLRNVLHLLRRASPEIDQLIETTPSTLWWRGGASCWTDVGAFVAALDRADSIAMDSDDGVAALRDAVNTYTGDLLEECYDEWLIEERERLRDRYLSALRRLTEALMRRSELAEAIEVGRELTRGDPLDENSHRLLLRAHAAAGDRAGAMRVFHECVATLQRELGVEPAGATRAAYAEVMRADEANAEDDGMHRGRKLLIGRHAEWERLTDCWRRAEAGESQLVVVSGEAGVGKTRLVDEWASWCAHRGAVVGRARSYATEGELGYGAVISWLRTPEVEAQVRRASPSDLAQLARLLPELEVDAHANPGTSDRADRQLLFDAVARVLTASGRPILLVADDAQWCDPPSLQLIHYLLRPRETTVVVAATMRREDLDSRHPLTALMTGGAELLDRTTELALQRLTRAQTDALARDLAGTDLDKTAAEALYAETEGNPLFVVEAMRAGWEGSGTRRRGLTPKLQAVIGARLQRLSEPALGLLGVAATAGRAFTAALVGQAAGLDDDALVRGLDELWRRGIIREHDADAYDFSHGRIRDVAYEALSTPARRRNHLLVAEALIAQHEDELDPVSGQVAVNFDRAGCPDEAIGWYRRAAVQAQLRYADAEAAQLLERARELVPSLPAHLRLDRELAVLSMLPTALGGVEGWFTDRQREVQGRAVEVAAALGAEMDPSLLRALVMSNMCRDEFDRAREAAERLRRAARRDGDVALDVESSYLLGIAAFWAGLLDTARLHFEEVIRSFRPERLSEHLLRFGHDPRVVCLSRLANTYWFLGDERRALDARDESLALAKEVGHPVTTDVAHWFAVVLAIDLKDYDGLGAKAAGFQGTASRTWVHDLNAAALQGFMSVLAGRIDAGIKAIGAAIDACGDQNPAPSYRPALLRLLLAAHEVAGDAERGLATTDRALQLGGTRLWEPEARRLRAEFTAALGGAQREVENDLVQALAVAERLGARGPAAAIERSRARLLGAG